ncbi:MAG: isoprenylcysteine carboxylmethyltransferase family protein [Acidobacteria bacterium]|nr:isoprenylcysteine carboxylmethyltransferase family protein [Acidobacteriota bacterium]
MRATDFEFRHRFWLFGLLFGASFWAYAIDHQNAGEALARLLTRDTDFHTAAGQRVLHGVFWAGALLVGLAALLRTWATAYLDSDRVHDANLRTESVVADGPYRYVRNPLYFANLLIAVGVGLAASRLGMALLVVGHVVYLSRLIGQEEAELLASQGETYRAYLAAVPRLWPALRPRLPASGRAPRWGQAFVGEIFFWLIFLGMALFAATLKAWLLPVVTAVGMAFYIGMFAVLKRRRAH